MKEITITAMAATVLIGALIGAMMAWPAAKANEQSVSEIGPRPARHATEIRNSKQTGVVILRCQESFRHDDQWNLFYTGIRVINYSSSSNAPAFTSYPEEGDQQAQAIADLMDQGFEIKSVSGNMLDVILVRSRQ